MKIFAITDNKQFMKIGETDKTSEWYAVTPAVSQFVTRLKAGDSVEVRGIRNDNGQLSLQFIKKLNFEQPSYPKEPTMQTPPQDFPDAIPPKQAETAPAWGMKSPEVQDSIKRQAIGHMTSRTLIALQGQIDLTNVESIIDRIYAKYVEKVG